MMIIVMLLVSCSKVIICYFYFWYKKELIPLPKPDTNLMLILNYPHQIVTVALCTYKIAEHKKALMSMTLRL
jgi:hypothetical protein